MERAQLRSRSAAALMAAALLTVDLHLPLSASLKDKRSVIKTLLEGSRSRYGVAAGELEHQDLRQRAVLGFAAVAASAGQVEAVLDSVERFVWSRAEVEVLETYRSWID
jgi:uncharacterized protein